MKKLNIAVSFVLAMAGGTFAGVKYAGPVSVGATHLSGSLGTARNSADSQQYIGCSITGAYATCSARTADTPTVPAKYGNCITSNTNLINAVRSIGPMSSLSITFDADTGDCRTISVTNYSYYA